MSLTYILNSCQQGRASELAASFCPYTLPAKQTHRASNLRVQQHRTAMPGIPKQLTYPFPSVSMLVLLSQSLHNSVNPEIKLFNEELGIGNTLCSFLLKASGDFAGLFSLLRLSMGFHKYK